MKAILATKLRKRISDRWGSGHFGAPRGNHTHNGIDYQCPAGRSVLSPCDGEVTKLGYPYGDDLSFRYIQITDSKGFDHRIFYVSPGQEMGAKIKEGQVIGISQDLTKRYPEITEHLHYEVRKNGEYIDPESI